MKFQLLIFILLPTFLFAQQSKNDSLLAIVQENKNDVASFRALCKLGERAEKTDRRLAIRYYRTAITFPFHGEYSNEFVQCYNLLGQNYHALGLYDSSLLMHSQAVEMAQQFNYEKEIGLGYQGLGLTFMHQSQIDLAKSYFNQALAIFSRLKDQSLEAGIYVDLGNVFLEKTNYTEALNQFIIAANIYEDVVHDPSGLARAWANIGNIQLILGHYDKASDYTKRSLQLFKENGRLSDIAYCYRLMGRIFRKQAESEKALRQYLEAMKIYQQLGDRRNLCETISSVGNIYFDLNKFSDALHEYEKALDLEKRISDAHLMANTFLSIAETHYKLKNFARAIAYLDSSLIRAKETGNRSLKMDAYEIISNIYEEQNHYREALKFHQVYTVLKDSLVQEENRQGTEEMEAKYQNVKKQTEIELLKKDQQLKNVSLQQNRTAQTAMIVAFGLLIVIGLLAFNRHRLIHQAKRQMEIEHMRNEIARDLHDDMGSTLSSIHIISQLALKENQAEPSGKYFQRISENSAKMMESMSDMVWSINPENDTLQKMLAKMKEFSAEILEPKNMSYQFHGEETLNGTVLDVAKRKNIFLIFKESINNAAKYSEGSSVNIHFAQVDNDLLLTIHDNGKGFDCTKAQNGNGLKNMKARALEINGQLYLEAKEGQGTTLKLKMSLT